MFQITQTDSSKKLIATLTGENPTYMDLFGSSDGLSVTVGDTTLPNINQVFAQPAEFSAARVTRLAAGRERLEKITAQYLKTEQDLIAQLQRNATKALSKQPGGKDEIKLAASMRTVGSIRVLADAVGVSNAIKKTRDASGVVLVARFSGGVITDVREGESAETAQARLSAMVNRDEITAAFAAAAGIQSVDSVGWGLRVLPQSRLAPGTVGAEVVVGLTLPNQKTLDLLIKRLSALQAPIPLLNPLTADNVTLAMNASPEDQIEQLAQEIEGAADGEAAQDQVEAHTDTPDFEDAV